jgi:hypothetical protein
VSKIWTPVGSATISDSFRADIVNVNTSIRLVQVGILRIHRNRAIVYWSERFREGGVAPEVTRVWGVVTEGFDLNIAVVRRMAT